MKDKEKKVETVVKFAQSATKTKYFHHDYPITDEVRKILLLDVYRDFTKYVLEENYAANQYELKGYVDEHDPEGEKREGLEHNLFWWKMLYDASQDDNMSCVERYIIEHEKKLNNKPLITSWLREWEKAIPKFYYVGHKYNDQVLVVVDMLTNQTLDVIVYDPFAVPSKKGEIVMGTLIPIGDALYFPIIDFYHFDFEARIDLVNSLDHHYDKHLESSTMLEAFIHVVSVALQIEQLVISEK